MQSIIEKEVPTGPTQVVSQRKYLEENFPISYSAGEYKVDYKDVGVNRFRVNFWTYNQTKSESLIQFRGSSITRSHYVVLKRKDSSWTHTII